MSSPVRARGRRRRAGRTAALGLAVGLVAAGVLTTPAAAAPTLAVSASPQTLNLSVGSDEQTVSINVQTSEPAENVTANVSVPLSEYGVTIKGSQGADCIATAQNTLGCTIGHMDPGHAAALYVSVTPPSQAGDIAPGDSRSGTGQVQVTADGAQPGSAGFNVTLTNDAPQSVGQISGSVLSATDGSAIPNASVTLTDSTGTSRQATTNDNGEYSWTPSDTETLAEGQITATAEVDGYHEAKQTQTGSSGDPLSFPAFKLKPIAKPKPSKTHAKPSPEPTKAADDGGGLGTIVWLLLILGALLVVGGIVAIILLLRKKDDDGDEGPGGDGILPFDSGPASGFPPRGAGDTAVINRVPGGDDAPTMVHNGPLVPPDNAQTQVYGSTGYDAGQTQVYGGETQAYGATPPAGPTADDATRTYPASAPSSGPGAVPPGGTGGLAGAGSAGGPAQPWQQSDRGVGGTYEGTMYGRGASGGAGYPGSAPASGYPGAGAPPAGGYPGQPTSGAATPTSGAGPGYGAPTSGGGYPGGPQHAQPRPDLNEPTRTWQAGQQGQQPRQQHRPAPPSADETRLDRNDGVDWLD